MGNQRILFDLTDFRSFRRRHSHLTGIQRVVFEVGRRLRDDAELDFACFFYDEFADRFHFADPALLDVPDTGPEGPAGSAVPRAGLKHRVRTLARRVAGIAGPLRPMLRRSELARRAYGVARRAVSPEVKTESIAFRPDDVVVVLGAPWESARMLERLVREQQEHGFEVATMVYDLIPADYPQFVFPHTVELFTSALRKVLAFSSAITVISEATKRSLLHWCAEEGIEAPPITVTYLGDDFHRPDQSTRPAGFPDGDFVLAVSTVEPRKNYTVLYQAVQQARLDGVELPRIVIVGRAGWKTDDLQDLLRNDPSLAGRLIWLDRVQDEELAWLYENTLFTLFPSIIEGWGLPVSESIHFGKFCISSGLSSMPEIAGDLVEYVSPYDSAAWYRAIHRYASDRELLAAREERIRTDYRGRRWGETASQVRAALPLR